VARVPLADLVEPANRFRVRHPSGYVGPAFGVADMVVWGFTAGLLDAVLEAAGLTRPWDAGDVRPLAAPPAAAGVDPRPGDRQPSRDPDPLDDDAADRAAPMIAEGTGPAAAPRTVRGR
jgi:hypothetical protein